MYPQYPTQQVLGYFESRNSIGQTSKSNYLSRSDKYSFLLFPSIRSPQSVQWAQRPIGGLGFQMMFEMKAKKLNRAALSGAMALASVLGSSANAMPAQPPLDGQKISRAADAEAVLGILGDVTTIGTQPECTDFTPQKERLNLGL